jgi:transcriptional regulator with XRE-family HTH domain
VNQSEISRLTGIGRGHLSLIFSGKVKPSIKTLLRIGKAVGGGKGLGLSETWEWLASVRDNNGKRT